MKLDSFSKSQSKCLKCPGAHRQVREKKTFVEIKPVPVVKHVKIWYFLAKVVQEHKLGAIGSTLCHTVGNLLLCLKL